MVFFDIFWDQRIKPINFNSSFFLRKSFVEKKAQLWKTKNENVKSSFCILPLIMGTHKKENSLSSWQQLAKSYQQRFRP